MPKCNTGFPYDLPIQSVPDGYIYTRGYDNQRISVISFPNVLNQQTTFPNNYGFNMNIIELNDDQKIFDGLVVQNPFPLSPTDADFDYCQSEYFTVKFIPLKF